MSAKRCRVNTSISSHQEELKQKAELLHALLVISPSVRSLRYDDSRRKAMMQLHECMMQIPASHDRRPQSCMRQLATARRGSTPTRPRIPSAFASIPAPSPLDSCFDPNSSPKISTNCLSSRREDLAFNESQACHAKIQGLFKNLFDFRNFQGFFKTLKTVFEIQVLFKVFKVRTHPDCRSGGSSYFCSLSLHLSATLSSRSGCMWRQCQFETLLYGYRSPS